MSDWILTEDDFPKNYFNKMHPEDAKITIEPIEPEVFRRISFQVTNGFIAFTFLCDTGAPSDFYLTESTQALLKCRITDEKIRVKGIEEELRVDSSPTFNSDINIIGLNLLAKLGMSININYYGGSFRLENLSAYF